MSSIESQRARSVLRELRVGKDLVCEILNTPESQYHRSVSSEARPDYCLAPDVSLIVDFCLEFGVSPNYLLLGVGEKWLCDIQTGTPFN